MYARNTLRDVQYFTENIMLCVDFRKAPTEQGLGIANEGLNFPKYVHSEPNYRLVRRCSQSVTEVFVEEKRLTLKVYSTQK